MRKNWICCLPKWLVALQALSQDLRSPQCNSIALSLETVSKARNFTPAELERVQLVEFYTPWFCPRK